MIIEELAFRDRRTLANLNEKDLLDIIEFLQDDRKEWINQFSKTHNESIKIQKENQELKEKYLNAVADYETTMSEKNELKKQLEERNIEYFKGAYDTHNKYYDQQQDLINWLEDKIHTIETTYSQINGNYGLMNEKLEALKEVLREYKKIIGVENENKTTI